MHKKHLLLCTAACALFFSYFNATYISNASGLSPQTRHIPEGINHYSERNSFNDLKAVAHNHKTMNSFGIVGKNPYFNQMIQNDLERERDRINSIFVGAGGYGSGTNQSELMNKLGHMYANALANQYNRDVLISIQTATMKDLEILEIIASGGMMGENSYFSQELREGLNRVQTDIIGNSSAKEDGYNFDTLKRARNSVHASAMAKQYNQDIQHMIQANAKLNKLRITHNALKKQSNTATNILPNVWNLDGNYQNAWNADAIKNVKRKGEPPVSPLPSRENKSSLIEQNANKGNSISKLSPVHATLKGKDNTSAITDPQIIPQPKTNKDLQKDVNSKTNSSSSKTTLPPSPDHVSLPTKTEAATQNPADTERASKEGKETATLSHDLSHPEEQSETLTPQIARYLVMPQALFSVGSADVKNQNTLLDNIRITMFEAKDHEEKGFFFSTYGKRSIFSSSSHTPQNSADTDIRYAALQAGLTLIVLGEQNTSTDFGFLGTYGKLAFTPKKKESSQKNMLNKWSLTAYGNIQHDSGVYASVFLSYGLFKGESPTALMKNTKTLAASATIGQKLPTIVEEIILEPQAQFVYQRLMLGILSNAENFKINMGNPDQWLLRIGGRLTQNKGDAVSFYGKVNIINTFGNNNTIQIDKKSFQTSPIGTSLEGGLGINAHLSQNVALHGDVSYQHKLKKAGESAINVSAGMRYRF
ncbi:MULTISPECIES: autotransporter outer membrane beta-barrel domain-containing protein [unclassified Bartonella]|uniref:autotransporter outer membrane beta-barrel domain-containing protein n=1 Tax=unclassified Bartonella TaxID=2645622 RepID=UPI0023610B58|nr:MULTISPECIES: autotransporter outer membrane beta-barrel domain-containing protein [unclassified Bartonella]